MDNIVIKQLIERKSVRQFEAKDISLEDKLSIIEAAKQAPTAGNQMMYSILNITDQSLKDKLAISCDNQPFIAKAPFVLIFCADFRRWYDSFLAAGCNPREPKLGDLILALSDTNIAAQNAVVAAESLGIGSCYIGDILEQCEFHRELLNLPKWVMPGAMVVFGYPTEGQKERTKPKRFNSKYIVFENEYKLLSPNEHKEMFEDRDKRAGTNRDFKTATKAFCERKYMSDFSLEMSRSVEVYLKDWK